MRHCALGPFADYKQSIFDDDDVARQCINDHILNPSAVGSLANGLRTTHQPAAN